MIINRKKESPENRLPDYKNTDTWWSVMEEFINTGKLSEAYPAWKKER